MKQNTITIFTDGSSRGNPGPGGWGAIISDGERVKEIGGREEYTTNNRMEMTAAIKALEFVLIDRTSEMREFFEEKRSATNSAGRHESGLKTVTVFTDSSYVAKGASEWLAGWQRKSWKNSQKQEVLNRDLWEKIAELIGGGRGDQEHSPSVSQAQFGRIAPVATTNSPRPDIVWKTIPGHSGIAGNERCDVIATSFADNAPEKLFDGSIDDYKIDLKVS